MPQNIKRKVNGFFLIIGIPILVVLGLVLLWVQSSFYAIPILMIVACIYVYILFGAVTYGPEQISDVNIPNTSVPEYIAELLKTTTIRGDLINVHLITAVEEEKNPNQSDLARHVRDYHKVTITQQTIREQYIVPLEKMGIIHSDAISKERAYKLTPRGKSCLVVVKTCFPRTAFWFFVRHYLGIMKLPEFKDVGNETPLADFVNK